MRILSQSAMSFSSSNTSPSNLFMYNSNAEKTLLHLSYIRTVRYAVRNNVNSFCLRPILSYFGRFPWYLSSISVTAEHRKRWTAYSSHGHLIPLRFSQSRPHCLSLWLSGSIIILLRFIALPESCSGFWSFIFFARPIGVMAYGFFGCRDFIPAAGLTYSRCWYSVFKMLKGFESFFFPFAL